MECFKKIGDGEVRSYFLLQPKD